MAPFRGRGAAWSRGRGRGTSRGGRDGHTSRGSKKPTFSTSRIEAQNEGDSNESAEAGSSSGLENEVLPEGESSDDEAPETVARPYSTLLQFLVEDVSQGKPQRKKRKIEHEVYSAGGDHGQRETPIVEPAIEDLGNDLVEEPEESAEQLPEEIYEEGDIDQAGDASDPFEVHFANPDDNDLSQKLLAILKGYWAHTKLTYQGVQASELAYVNAGASPPLAHDVWRNLKNFRLKRRLIGPAEALIPHLNAAEAAVAPYIASYQDVLFCHRSHENAESLRRLTCLHALDHVFKTRDRVIKDSARLAKENEAGELELRDQGFTRPKVLILLPTRHSCVRAVETMVALCQPEQQENKKRFQESYEAAEDQFSEDKPVDFRDLFGGNNDDMFRLGLKFTRKTIKYFSQFYNSDIIFASPLGLRMAVGTEEYIPRLLSVSYGLTICSNKKQDHDFLSSIELVIVDQADALLMQNWEHVQYIFEHLNLQPKEAHGCDFSRVRTWYLDNNAKYLRQTIILAAFNTPELNHLYNTQMRNVAGKVRFVPNYQGEIFQLPLQVKQIFSRYDSISLAADPDIRFKYFTAAVLPTLTRHTKPASSPEGSGLLLFVPSYHDFVRIRNFFASSTTTANISFGFISEYTSVREVARARSHFLSGRHSILLYTERAHHFRRYNIRGVKQVIMYGLPNNPIFYRELVGGFLGETASRGVIDTGEGKVRALFSKWDVLKLERIVGREKARSMLSNKGGDTFEFI
ncbi:MAG: rRNA-binding ribosome biosynthesis protein utp25 [Candelina mexicana]|nr:MAG: rRNA-binding ribosome biosynthesis protein utp25 [Candelina mexicana]